MPRRPHHAQEEFHFIDAHVGARLPRSIAISRIDRNTFNLQRHLVS
jgi:hypothetical protein